jgi:small subunit ribosomal protein S16
LARVGAKKKPFHRLVATDSRTARDGRCIEILGTYSPNKTPKFIGLNEERVFYWLDNGAQMSATVRTLLKGQGVLERRRMRGEPSLEVEQGEEIEAIGTLEDEIEGSAKPETPEA